MDKGEISNICKKYDVETPESFHNRVKWFAHTAFARNIPKGMIGGFAGNNKAPQFQLMDILNEIGSLSERIAYLKELKGLIPKENGYSVITNDLMVDINTPKYRKFRKFVGEQYRELQELRYEKLKANNKPTARAGNDEGEHKRELSEECLERIQEIANDFSKLGVNDTFKKAYESKCCQYEIVDGERKEIGSWSTLRNRVKGIYPEVYEVTKVQK